MGILDRAIRRGVNRAIGDAVAKGVEQAVAPQIEKAAASVADNVNEAAAASAQVNEAAAAAAAPAGGLLSSLQGAANQFATEAAKNMKICPSCGEPAAADKKFCPSCGGKLPDETIAQGSVCSKCGKQNDIGTKFCAECGEKLPAAVAEEKAEQERRAAVLADWERLLPQYPQWPFGGSLELEEVDRDENGNPLYQFSVSGTSRAELEQYRDLLIQNGFKQCGQYPTRESLYKMIDGVCYNFDSSSAFESEPDYLTAGFRIAEPHGGYDYVKPEPKKPASLKDLLGL